MRKLTRVISPSYVTGFKCIGGECEDSCCIGWDIDIDKITYRKYFRTKDMQMKKEFIKHVYRNDECDSEEVDYGRVHINESKWCPFLDESKLCRIYSNLGEDYLSNVCYSYPRVYNILDGVYELSLYMSCPEAIRKLLENEDPIQFKEEKSVLDKHIIHSSISTVEDRWKKSPVRRLKELRTMSIKMVQNRKYSIQKRLLRLGYELEKICLSDSPDRYHNDSAIKVQDSCTFQVGFFREAIESLQVFTEIDSPVFIEYTEKLQKQFRLEENIPLQQKAKTYRKMIETIVQPFVNENAYLFEHYLVSFMFQGNFPFTENQNIFDGYLMLVVRFAFIRFYLAGIAAVEGKITVDDVVVMIQVYTKTIEHHKTFTLDLLQDIKEKMFDSMEFTSLLLG